MAKRRIDEILDETLPENSKQLYLKRWTEFLEFLGDTRRPTEEDYLQYFDFLKNTLEYLFEFKFHPSAGIFRKTSDFSASHAATEDVQHDL